MSVSPATRAILGHSEGFHQMGRAAWDRLLLWHYQSNTRQLMYRHRIWIGR